VYSLKKKKSNKKKIVFLSGTRADYGKLKSLILAVKKNSNFEYKIFITGMHNLKKYGNTYEEIIKDKFYKYHLFNNQNLNDSMDIILSKTIKGFSKFIEKEKPDLVVVHGDRVEPLGCAIVCTLNNILLAHVEGGEVSGTVDEMLRHSISKLSHLHFVSNAQAKKRLIQMGEDKKRYDISFKNYGLIIFHPVTTDIKNLNYQVRILSKAVKKTNKQYVVIYPNNDLGANIILSNFKKYFNNKNFKILPSMRFEYFLTLLNNAKVIIGNSSAAIREAPFFGIPSINLGSRQYKRSKQLSIINMDFNEKEIFNKLNYFFSSTKKFKKSREFGDGKSSKRFVQIILNKKFYNTKKQKHFIDI
jgi:UDP-N-acetylglucosamine 2-epimerase (hydrolysing)